MIIKNAGALKGEIRVPGDKSISHRAVMFGALAKGRTEIDNFLTGADCLSTIGCFRTMGIEIERRAEQVTVLGKGIYGLRSPEGILDCGNSGTTTRLISGILSGQSFESHLTGDESIQKRPMKRIMDPLRAMGADIISERDNGCAPLIIRPAALKGIDYASPVASAQVKSSVLLAGLYAEGETSVREPHLSRNHTEIMLKSFGADISSDPVNCIARIKPGRELYGQHIVVPGDISSAAYFIVAALIVPGSEVLIRNVGINETRDGIIRILRQMGGDIVCLNERRDGEPVADLLVRHSELKGTVVEGDVIPTLIDELPVIAVAAAFAQGQTIIRDAAELKVKESDRIETVTAGLIAMGAGVLATDDGMIIQGGGGLQGGIIESRKDHRIAMSFAVAALAADGETRINDAECVNISYPDFYSDLRSLCGENRSCI